MYERIFDLPVNWPGSIVRLSPADLQDERSAVRRPKSSNKEPEVSDNQREMLLALIAERVSAEHMVVEYDPVVAMALIATDPEINGRDVVTGDRVMNAQRNLGLALAAHREVAKYTRPQLKQIEVTGAGGGPLEVKTKLAIDIVELMAQLTGTSTVKKGEDSA